MTPTSPIVLGIDIGGANLKAASSSGAACTVPFALWKHVNRLPGALADLVRSIGDADILAVTMTGELCDCFADREQGVRHIVSAVESSVGTMQRKYWTIDGQFVSVSQALASPRRLASANWLALATLTCRELRCDSGLLIDVGSTTSDITYLTREGPDPRGRTDAQRFRTGELVYSGLRRTPLSAVLGLEVAGEYFASMLDVYVVLGVLPESPEDCDTADGRPRTRFASLTRLARSVCADLREVDEADLIELAVRAQAAQRRKLAAAILAVMEGRGKPLDVIVAGSGEAVARNAVDAVLPLADVSIRSLSDALGPESSEAACAVAVMRLAMEAGVAS